MEETLTLEEPPEELIAEDAISCSMLGLAGDEA